jgi:hypothetical protein
LDGSLTQPNQIIDVDQDLGCCLDWSQYFGVPALPSSCQFNLTPKFWLGVGNEKERQYFGLPMHWQGAARPKPNMPYVFLRGNNSLQGDI